MASVTFVDLPFDIASLIFKLLDFDDRRSLSMVTVQCLHNFLSNVSELTLYPRWKELDYNPFTLRDGVRNLIFKGVMNDSLLKRLPTTVVTLSTYGFDISAAEEFSLPDVTSLSLHQQQYRLKEISLAPLYARFPNLESLTLNGVGFQWHMQDDPQQILRQPRLLKHFMWNSCYSLYDDGLTDFLDFLVRENLQLETLVLNGHYNSQFEEQPVLPDIYTCLLQTDCRTSLQTLDVISGRFWTGTQQDKTPRLLAEFPNVISNLAPSTECWGDRLYMPFLRTHEERARQLVSARCSLGDIPYSYDEASDPELTEVLLLLPNVEHLRIEECPTPNAAFMRVWNLNLPLHLESLTVNFLRPGPCMQFLQSLPHLKRLAIGGEYINWYIDYSEPDIIQYPELPCLEEFSLLHARGMTSAVLEFLNESCTNLRSLTLGNWDSTVDLSVMSACTRLTRLTIYRLNDPDHLSMFPNLEYLSSPNPQPGNDLPTVLASYCPKIRTVTSPFLRLKPFLRNGKFLPQLRAITIRTATLTGSEKLEDCMEYLEQLRALQEIYIELTEKEKFSLPQVVEQFIDQCKKRFRIIPLLRPYAQWTAAPVQ